MAKSIQDATVVVIGAGAAGIMAARSLREKGCRQIIVLEARDRVGASLLRAGSYCTSGSSPPFSVSLGILTIVCGRRTDLQHFLGN